MHTNRENAKRSTGPITAAGKAKSSLNSQTHGLSQLDSVGWEDLVLHRRTGAVSVAELQYRIVREVAHSEILLTLVGGDQRREALERLCRIERYRKRHFRAWLRAAATQETTKRTQKKARNTI